MLQNYLNNFKMLFSNEENTPEILPYGFNIIFFFKELIHYQINFIPENKNAPNFFDFFEILKKMELDRIFYLFKNYHKIRILKIERNFGCEQHEKKFFNLLNQTEKKYAHAYNFFFFNYIENYFLDFSISNIKNKLKLTKKICTDIEKFSKTKDFFVFFRILNKKLFLKKNSFSLSNLSNYHKNEIYCMKFNSIKRLIFSGIIILI